MPDFIQPSFASGVLDPELHGRVDIAKYHTGLAEGHNVFVHPYGGVSNRPGFEYVAPAAAKSHAPAAGTNPVRLIPFRLADNDAYVLEFGDEYMRVIRNGAYVVGGALTGVTSSRDADGNTVFTKTGFAGHGYQNGDEVHLSGFSEAVELNGLWAVVAERTHTTFKLKDQITGEDIASPVTQETTGGSTSKIYEIVTPYGSEHVQFLKFVQANDVVTIVSRFFDAMELKRYGHNTWAIEPVNYSAQGMGPVDVEKLPAPTNVAISSGVGSLVLTFDRVATAEYYAIAYDTSSSSINLIYQETNPTVLQGPYPRIPITISGLTSGTTYYARVRAVENIGQGVTGLDTGFRVGLPSATMSIRVG